jgi:hypothetical protein
MDQPLVGTRPGGRAIAGSVNCSARSPDPFMALAVLPHRTKKTDRPVWLNPGFVPNVPPGERGPVADPERHGDRNQAADGVP